jgi:hypothetical protein
LNVSVIHTEHRPAKPKDFTRPHSRKDSEPGYQFFTLTKHSEASPYIVYGHHAPDWTLRFLGREQQFGRIALNLSFSYGHAKDAEHPI